MLLTWEDVTPIIPQKRLWLFLSAKNMCHVLDTSPRENRYARLLNRNGLHICSRKSAITVRSMPSPPAAGYRWGRRENGAGRHTRRWASPGPAPSCTFTHLPKPQLQSLEKMGKKKQPTRLGNCDSGSNSSGSTKPVFRALSPTEVLTSRWGGLRICASHQHPG